MGPETKNHYPFSCLNLRSLRSRPTRPPFGGEESLTKKTPLSTNVGVSNPPTLLHYVDLDETFDILRYVCHEQLHKCIYPLNCIRLSDLRFESQVPLPRNIRHGIVDLLYYFNLYVNNFYFSKDVSKDRKGYLRSEGYHERPETAFDDPFD